VRDQQRGAEQLGDQDGGHGLGGEQGDQHQELQAAGVQRSGPGQQEPDEGSADEYAIVTL